MVVAMTTNNGFVLNPPRIPLPKALPSAAVRSEPVGPESIMEYGRLYHGFEQGKYLFPCDEDEKDRMDIFHKLFSVARRGAAHSGTFTPNYDAGPRILDLGTGTGIWAIEMADNYKGSEVVGLDLSRMQPQSVPSNLRFYQRDFHGPWDGLGKNSWDMIHMRMLNGSIYDDGRVSLYQNILEHLKPGIGWLEQIEIDFSPRCDDGSLSNFADISNWYRYLEDATMRHGCPIRYDPNMKDFLASIGFVNIREQVIRLPLNPWEKDPHLKDIGRWYNLGLTQGLQALTMKPLCLKSNWSTDRVNELLGLVGKEVCSRKLHVYHEIHIWTAFRPGP